jgi:hypothetical protein
MRLNAIRLINSLRNKAAGKRAAVKTIGTVSVLSVHRFLRDRVALLRRAMIAILARVYDGRAKK